MHLIWNIQINLSDRHYKLEPNDNYRNTQTKEEKIFCDLLKQYQWDKYKNETYNSGRHHIYVIFKYKREI